MIKAVILHNNSGMAVGFTVKSHGDPKVCAAVSALVINAINSIFDLCAISEGDVFCKMNDNGFVGFCLKRSSQRTSHVGLLLDSLVIALSGMSRQFPKDVAFDSMSVHSLMLNRK